MKRADEMPGVMSCVERDTQPKSLQSAGLTPLRGNVDNDRSSEVSPGSIWKQDFPLLRESSVAFLDSGASAQKPEAVLGALDEFYRTSYANIHRGVYELSERATAAFEGAREKVRRFINAPAIEEVIFTHGATEGVNLVATAWGESSVNPGDELVVSLLEHHANFVPWQILARRTGAVIRYVGLDQSGRFDLEALRVAVGPKTKLIAITSLANGYGIIPPVREIIELARTVGARVLVDAAQSIAHMPLDVAGLGADFVVFSGHKIYGPTGIGVLWAKREILEEMPPFLTGGDMIRSVSVNGTEWNDLPAKFEAGTPHIAGGIGLGAAIDYVEGIGLDKIAEAETVLVRLLEDALSRTPGVRILGPAGEHHALVCFEYEGIHPHDLGQFLSSRGVAVRSGHHCAQPLLEHLGLHATTRASLGLYNTPDDIERLAAALVEAKKFFRV